MLATRSSTVLALLLVVGCRGEPSGDGEVQDVHEQDPVEGEADTDVGPGHTDAPDGDLESCDCPGELDTEDEEPVSVPETTHPLCRDGIDNDLDGQVDCADSDCCRGGSCGCDDCDESMCVFRGGECYCDQGDCFDPDGCTGEDSWSYVRDISVPPTTGAGACCFDFDGDRIIDNGLVALLSAISDYVPGFDAQDEIRDALARDLVSIVFGWGRGAEGNGFWWYWTRNDVDRDGEPDQSFEARAAGNGVFAILPGAVDQRGALTQFNVATDDGSEFQAGPSRIRLSAPFDDDSAPPALEIAIERAFVTGGYSEDESGRLSVDSAYEVDGATVTHGGWMLGGLVPLDTVGAYINKAGGSCRCAGISADEPLLTYGDDGTRFSLECTQIPALGCTNEDGAVCAHIVEICELLPALLEAGINDIDADGNGVGDTMSVGLWLSAVGATFSDPPLLPGEQRRAR